MRLPQIQIQQGFARIDLNIPRPILDIEQKPADVQIVQKPAELHVERIKGSFNVDATEARANMDMKSIRRRIFEIADLALQDVLDGIAAKSSEGDQLGQIENKNVSIGSMAMDNLLGEKELYDLPYNPDYMQIEFIPDQLKIDWKVNKPDIQVIRNKPVITYTPGKVETYIKQKNWINIEPPIVDRTV